MSTRPLKLLLYNLNDGVTEIGQSVSPVAVKLACVSLLNGRCILGVCPRRMSSTDQRPTRRKTTISTVVVLEPSLDVLCLENVQRHHAEHPHQIPRRPMPFQRFRQGVPCDPTPYF